MKIFLKDKIKNHSNRFRIVCDPSSGSIKLYLTEIIRSGSLMFVVCLVGVWQRNFEPVHSGPESYKSWPKFHFCKFKQ